MVLTALGSAPALIILLLFAGIIDVEACFPDPPSVINCRWGEWEYESCSVTCGGGSQTGVRRPVVQAQNGGRPCTGTALDERACNAEACQADCEWAAWGSWSSCTDSCGPDATTNLRDGTGDQNRTRGIVTQAVNGGVPCNTTEAEGEQSCTVVCPIDCEWAPWGTYSECGTSCSARDGTGDQTRTRTKTREAANGGTECPEDGSDDQSCTVQCPVDCQWASWVAWTTCTDSCSAADGTGDQTRSRTATAASNSGTACVPADGSGTQSCSVMCPVNCAYGDWVWDDCSVTCGDGGFQIGTRPILTEASGGGNPCDQETVMGRACREDPTHPSCTPVDCVYGAWIWNPCPVTCGDSLQTGHRVILSQPMAGGAACTEPLDASQACSTGVPCPDDCRWAPWVAWSICTDSCGPDGSTGLRDGTGDQTRTREIATEEVNMGTPCNLADGSGTQSCGDVCPVDCEWATWESWSTCTDSCSARDGTGDQTRTRVKTRELDNGGNDCPPTNSEDQACTVECPADCQWASWGTWTTCTDSCSALDGTGDQTRSRTSTAALNGGTACVLADGSDTQSCADVCPINCVMGAWGSWSDCGTSCSARDGTGDQTRTRSPTTLAANGGTECTESPLTEPQACTVFCPVDCDWAIWGAWSDCARKSAGTCGVQGDGETQRTRTHDPAAANAGAVDCEATSMEENWLCCADGNTDAGTCTNPAEVCLTGIVAPQCRCVCGDVLGVRQCECTDDVCTDCAGCCQTCRTTDLTPPSSDQVQSDPLANDYACSALDASLLPMKRECHPEE